MLIKIYFSLQLPFASDIVDFVGIHHQRTVPVYDIYEKSIRFRTPKHYYSSEKSVMEKKKKKDTMVFHSQSHPHSNNSAAEMNHLPPFLSWSPCLSLSV